jgi:hypothetical protein
VVDVLGIEPEEADDGVRGIEGPAEQRDAVRRGRVQLHALPRERLHSTRLHEPEVQRLHLHGVFALDADESTVVMVRQVGCREAVASRLPKTLSVMRGRPRCMYTRASKHQVICT